LTRIRTPKKLLLATLVSLIAQPLIYGQAPVSTGSLSGQVICSDTRTPCRFASVTIQSLSSALESASKEHATPVSFSTSTNLGGFYSISGVPPGDYYVIGRLAGYTNPYDLLTTELGGDLALSRTALDAALPTVHVGANQTTRSNLVLSRGASLSGVVRYDDGAVAIALAVHLWRKDHGGIWKPYRNGSGSDQLAPLFSAMHTDERGRYFAPGLPPGQYLIEADLPETSIIPSTITGRQSLNISIKRGDALKMFSGDKYRLREAASYDLHEGDSLSVDDITIPTVGLSSIEGVVTAKADGRTLAQAKIQLQDPETKEVYRETDSQQDGTFVFNYVVPGTYGVHVQAAGNDKGSKSYAPLNTSLVVVGDVSGIDYAVSDSK
jgi:hypothetical protein